MISQNVGLYPHGKIERAEPGNIETGQVGPGQGHCGSLGDFFGRFADHPAARF